MKVGPVIDPAGYPATDRTKNDCVQAYDFFQRPPTRDSEESASLVIRTAVATAGSPAEILSSSSRIILVMVERNPRVRLEARLALAAEHPDHYAYERDDKDKKVDRPSHGYSPRNRPAVGASDCGH